MIEKYIPDYNHNKKKERNTIMAQYCIILIQICMVANALEKIIETIGKRHFAIKRKFTAFCAQLILSLSGSDQSTYFLKSKSSRCACGQKSRPKKVNLKSSAKKGENEKVKLCPPIDPVLFLKSCRYIGSKHATCARRWFCDSDIARTLVMR